MSDGQGSGGGSGGLGGAGGEAGVKSSDKRLSLPSIGSSCT